MSLTGDRFRSVLSRRRGGITLALENVRKENVALVARTAEALGVASLHLVYTRDMDAHLRGFGMVSEATRAAQLSRVSRSATDWLDITAHSSVDACVSRLGLDGFDNLVATAPDADTSLYDEAADDWALDRVALLFGSEGHGLSREFLGLATHRVSVPLSGMTQSLNVAACAAIVLGECLRRRDAAGAERPLAPPERHRLEATLLRGPGVPLRYHNKASVKAQARRYKPIFEAQKRREEDEDRPS
ncbi:hypothetical protein CTAYLR_007261 [Chrysophaeum taylorii]|uniref:tRNA/rRNA methyltransferase SpoU type domain-containing protein n=1 Tax=Chrysophaeum taylorii TaxID=2483200 RepID=A0AAD7XKL7_9STRA|nr:hypothetical protein CTAYLR_007261 [Chrysophaeum taylorii]